MLRRGKAGMKKKFSIPELLLFMVEKTAIFFAFAIPHSWCEGFGKIFGRIYYLFSKKRRHVAISNLQLAFPQMPDKERNHLARLSFESFGINYVEGIKIAKMTPYELKSMVRIAEEDEELYQKLISSDKGTVLLGCHSGSLPMLLAGLSVYGLKLHSITGTGNRYTDAWLKKKASLFGLDLIIRGNSKGYSELLSILESHEAVNFFTDMDWSYSKGVFVDFFGKPASSPRGPARIFYRHDYWPVMVMVERKKSFNYVIHLKEFAIDRTSNDKEQFVINNMQHFTSYFEEKIRKDPADWTWQHPRWKTRPEDEESEKNA
jgi:KDO2-lipid IV(A) lauroyltransferase